MWRSRGGVCFALATGISDTITLILYIDLADAKLHDALHALRAEDLSAMIKLLPIDKPYPIRKADMVGAIMEHLAGEPLREVWADLDETQRLAVAEALYDSDRMFRQDRFHAKYGKLPNGLGGDVDRRSSPLRLLLYPTSRYGQDPVVVPTDLAGRLRAFVETPPDAEISAVAELPSTFPQGRRGYVARGDARQCDQVELVRRDMERAAAHDLLTVLRLTDRGLIGVSAKTRRPSAAATQRIAALLDGGDFFDPAEERKNRWDQLPGPVRGHAWPWLLQAGRLAEPRGSKLALTKAGRAALNASTADTLKHLWDRWVWNSLFDEFSRIDDVKGQTRGRGKRAMTLAAERRDSIQEALARCPVCEWVPFEEFSRFMRASSLTFEVTRDPWSLYLVESHYGSLGYSGAHDWDIVQGRYLLCVLFEYAATLGLVDIAYTRPEGARLDFTDLSNADELTYLSRYDGLRYFRLNPLGAFCLELAAEYTPSQPEVGAALRVFPDRRLQPAGGTLATDEALLLETYAHREAADVWRLDGTKLLLAIENGHDIGELREFIAARDDQELPEPVEGFLRNTERDARALAPRGTASLFECTDADIAARLAQDRTTGKLCLLAGERHLAVPAKSEKAFRKAVHGMGYGMSGR